MGAHVPSSQGRWRGILWSFPSHLRWGKNMSNDGPMGPIWLGIIFWQVVVVTLELPQCHSWDWYICRLIYHDFAINIDQMKVNIRSIHGWYGLYMLSRWWLWNMFLFLPLLGDMIQVDEHSFQMGGWNHQRVIYSIPKWRTKETPQLYGDYKPLQGSLLNKQDWMESKAGFFRGSSVARFF